MRRSGKPLRVALALTGFLEQCDNSYQLDVSSRRPFRISGRSETLSCRSNSIRFREQWNLLQYPWLRELTLSH